MSRNSIWALTLLAAASLIAGERPAQAILNYYIYESGGNVVLETSGSLNLSSGTPANVSCAGVQGGGSIVTALARFCSGPNITGSTYTAYTIAGPTNISAVAGNVNVVGANSVTGLRNFIGLASSFFIDPSYSSGNPIVSNATFNNRTLGTGANGLGFTTTGLIGTWTLTGTNDTINVVVGAPPAPSAVPGPLPLLGAGAAFGFSRRLRRRVSLSRSIPHSATSISA